MQNREVWREAGVGPADVEPGTLGGRAEHRRISQPVGNSVTGKTPRDWEGSTWQEDGGQALTATAVANPSSP